MKVKTPKRARAILSPVTGRKRKAVVTWTRKRKAVVEGGHWAKKTRGPGARQRFTRLTLAWRHETQFSGTVIEIATNPSYQQIIGMGRPAIRLILADLARGTDHWFWALKAITGEDPVPAEDRGDLEKMRQAWLTWGHRHGYA